MPSYRQGDLAQVPFPYTDRATRQRRPAFVLSTADLEEKHSLLWVVMITSAENRRWPDDVAIADHAAAGLPAPSIVRTAKIATIDARDAEPIGRLPTAVTNEVVARVAQNIGWDR